MSQLICHCGHPVSDHNETHGCTGVIVRQGFIGGPEERCCLCWCNRAEAATRPDCDTTPEVDA